MTYNEREFVSLKVAAARHFDAKEYQEAQIALSVANQFRNTLTPAQRERADRAIAKAYRS